jgi:hypothetical protein
MVSHPDEATFTQGHYLRKKTVKGREQQEMGTEEFIVLTSSTVAAASADDDEC